MGTEYSIDEFCIKTPEQGRGLGTRLLREIEICIREKGIQQIFLQTERAVPAYEFYRKNVFFELDEYVSLAKRI